MLPTTHKVKGVIKGPPSHHSGDAEEKRFATLISGASLFKGCLIS
jgi:hypothetical protein